MTNTKNNTTYAIIGATGNIGNSIAHALLGEGKEVRVLGRSADRLQPLVEKGAVAYVGEVTDQAYLDDAFEGVDAAFTMVPGKLDAEDYSAFQREVGAKVTAAISRNGVKHVVQLSTIGADDPDAPRLFEGLLYFDRQLENVEGLNLVILRPTYFFENTFNTLPGIAGNGIVGTTLKGDVSLPMIATADIAKVATEYLTDLNFEGVQVKELLGERDLTFNEITGILKDKLELDELNYVQFPYEDAKAAMVNYGISEDVADLYNDMSEKFNQGVIVSTKQRTPANSTFGKFEDFVESVFKPAYMAGLETTPAD